MDHAQRTPEQALDLLLALRPEDLEDDLALYAMHPGDERDAIEAQDAEFAVLLDAWADAPLREPTFSASDIFALAQAEVERPDSSARTAGRVTAGSSRSWLAPVGLAAGLAISVLGLWALQPSGDDGATRAKSLVSDAAATRIGLEVSVERATSGRVLVTPGRQGAAYGPDEALAFRFALAGQPGWATLLEVTPEGDWSVVYPAGGPLLLQAGEHVVADARGTALVYRPDAPQAGTLTYVVIVTSEPVEPSLVVPGLLSAGFDRADLWPRPVVATDAFTVTWTSP